MNPKITELASRLGELSDDEMRELRELVLADHAKVEELADSPEKTTALSALADVADKLTAKVASRAMAQLTAEPEAVTAAGARGGRVTRLARRRSTQASPERGEESTAPAATLVASAAMRGVTPGQPITDPLALAMGLCATLEAMHRSGPPRGDVVVASATWEYPEERQLTDSLAENERKLAAICAPAALVATGGICQPVNVDYAVPTWATADRPIRDGLPAFQATRGGVRFVAPPDISGLAEATGIWTEATDAEPGESTKNVLRVECGNEEAVFVDAVPTRLQFGNLMGRFAPEWMAANVDLATAAAARIAENNLLNLIAEKCVKGVTTATLLGATRDLLVACDQASAQYRQLHRIPRSQTLTAILPDWARDLIRADIARELAHGNVGDRDPLAITDDQVDALLLARGIKPIWHLDGQGEEVEGGVSQVFAAPAKGAIKEFPTKLVWYLFAEGSLQFLDGGRLDLGVVRDSTLDATNDFELFVEPFESVAFRGFSGGALQLVSTLCANGASAGTVSTEGHCA
jgi:hypothetical protein